MNTRVRLKEVCDEITVGHVGPMAKEYVEYGIPFLRSQNILRFRIDNSNVKYISERFHHKLKKSALSPGDVVVVRTGYPGTACVIPRNLPVANCADLVVIRPSERIDGYYLCCIFNSAWGQGQVSGSLVGVAQQHFNVGVAKEMEISLPDIATQRRIGAILSAYDDLIENNTRRIKILEEMAQMIYREWFVHFRFPGHEKVRMVESELGPIPEGWRVRTLRDATTVVSRGISPRYDDSAEGLVINQRCIRDHKVNLSPARRQSKPVPPQKLVRGGDILVNSTGVGTLGRVAQVHEDIPNCTVDSHVTIVRPIKHREYLGQVVLGLESYFEGAGVGSTGQTELGKTRIAESKFVSAPDPLQEAFCNQVHPMNTLVATLLRQNENLRETRDLLLPKLISGEIAVEATEEPELAEAV